MTSTEKHAGHNFLIFPHIPKTAGTSVRLRMKEALSNHDPAYTDIGVYNFNDWVRVQDFLRMPIEDNLKFLYGHIELSRIIQNPCIKIRTARSTVICFLRDPVDRLISSYNYIATSPKHPLNQECISTPQKEFLSKISKSDENIQHRYLEASKSHGMSYVVALNTEVPQACSQAFNQITGKPIDPDFFDKRINVTRDFRKSETSKKLYRSNMSEKELRDIYSKNDLDKALFDIVSDSGIIETNPTWMLWIAYLHPIRTKRGK